MDSSGYHNTQRKSYTLTFGLIETYDIIDPRFNVEGLMIHPSDVQQGRQRQIMGDQYYSIMCSTAKEIYFDVEQTYGETIKILDS